MYVLFVRRNITLNDQAASLKLQGGYTCQAMTPDIGDRIRLIHTHDRYTKLKRGDLGSITDVIYLLEDYGGQAQIWVRWDAGSILALIDGQDEWEAVE
jgi:Domain of unknown function (DUF4314)